MLSRVLTGQWSLERANAYPWWFLSLWIRMNSGSHFIAQMAGSMHGASWVSSALMPTLRKESSLWWQWSLVWADTKWWQWTNSLLALCKYKTYFGETLKPIIVLITSHWQSSSQTSTHPLTVLCVQKLAVHFIRRNDLPHNGDLHMYCIYQRESQRDIETISS